MIKLEKVTKVYKGEVVAQGEWDPILTPEDTAHLQAILTDPSRLTRRSARRYLLTGGLLRCGLCDAVMVARPRADGTRRYVCAKGPGLAGCGRVAVMSEPVEELITEAILSFIGAGVPPITPSWGNIMAEGRALWQVKPFIVFFPAAFLSITVLAVNLVGDGLRDALDPRLAKGL